jgi:hypothetical protein
MLHRETPPPCEPVSLHLFKRRLRGTTHYPGGPCGPSTPCMPCTPCAPCIPRTPCKLGGPCGPRAPASPAAPAAPAGELLAGQAVQGYHFPLASPVAKLLPPAPVAPVLLLALVVQHSHANPADLVDLVDPATLAVPDVRGSDYFSAVTFTGEIVRYRK